MKVEYFGGFCLSLCFMLKKGQAYELLGDSDEWINGKGSRDKSQKIWNE